MTKLLPVFLSPSRWMQRHYHERVHDHFLPFSIVSKISLLNLPTIYSMYIVCAADRIIVYLKLIKEHISTVVNQNKEGEQQPF
jgi:hypothetical protein